MEAARAAKSPPLLRLLPQKMMGRRRAGAAQQVLALAGAVIICCAHLLPTAASATFPGDTEALRQLKAALEPASVPPGSCLSSWDFSAADPCDALFSGTHFTCGFRCDARDSAGLARVTDISLDSAGYAGLLSPAVWSLPFLQTLDAPENRLYGSIPPPPPSSDLRQLRRVTLSRNAFSGGIPTHSFPSLEELNLDGNFLSGPIPAATAPSFPSLRRLELQMNNLSGGFPDLSSMATLSYFDASDNNISGPMPPAKAVLPPSLVELVVRGNALEGSLPAYFTSGSANLQVLDLSHNRLSGSVPASLFLHPALQQLTLSYNRLTSLEQSPPWWGWWRRARRSSGLVAVDLAHNRLSGTLPLGWIRAMPKLTALSLEDNLLTGMIPMEYAVRVAGARAGTGYGGAAAAPLARLLLAGNYLYGPIPSPLAAVKQGDAAVSLANNCLFQCSDAFFFCLGAGQKQPTTCRSFNPVIP